MGGRGSKAGLSEEVRASSVGALPSTSGAAAVGGVDLSTHAVRQFAQIIHDISEGTFQPDRANAKESR